MKTVICALLVAALAACAGDDPTFRSEPSPASSGAVTACETNVKTLQVAQEAHFAKDGVYAADVAALIDAELIREDPSDGSFTYTTDSSGKVYVQQAGGARVEGEAGCTAA